MAAPSTSSFYGVLDHSSSTDNGGHGQSNDTDAPQESSPYDVIANYVRIVGNPVIFTLGIFGNVMTIVIGRRMTSSGESVIQYYFTGLAIFDLTFLLSVTMPGWLKITFRYYLDIVNTPVCKLTIWLSTMSGTISAWFLVSLTLHRALSVVWPHRVNVLCTRRIVLSLLIGIALVLAALYAHYLYGSEILFFEVEGRHMCWMEGEAYMTFVFDVFVYIELALYSLLPFVLMALGNAVLVWKLRTSVKNARQKLSQGNAGRQSQAREKAAGSVTLTVMVVSLTFIVLTLPVSVDFIMSFIDIVVSEEAQSRNRLWYYAAVLLYNANSAVNFYLYCLTGTKFREQFLTLMGCRRS